MSPLAPPCSAMVMGNKDLDFGRERERGAGKVMLLEIDLDFCVYVRENKRKRGAKKIILFGFKLWCCWILCLVSKKVQGWGRK